VSSGNRHAESFNSEMIPSSRDKREGMTTILAQEKSGYNVIITEIASDIINTLEVIGRI
jgi:hypothetical protein